MINVYYVYSWAYIAETVAKLSVRRREVCVGIINVSVITYCIKEISYNLL